MPGFCRTVVHCKEKAFLATGRFGKEAAVELLAKPGLCKASVQISYIVCSFNVLAQGDLLDVASGLEVIASFQPALTRRYFGLSIARNQKQGAKSR